MVGNIYHRLDPLKHALGIEQPNGIARNQSTQRVSYDADLLDVMAASSELLECLFYLGGNPLSSGLDAIVGKAPSIALDDEDVELVFGELVAKGGAEEFEVVRVAPESVVTVLVLALASATGVVGGFGSLIGRRKVS